MPLANFSQNSDELRIVFNKRIGVADGSLKVCRNCRIRIATAQTILNNLCIRVEQDDSDL